MKKLIALILCVSMLTGMLPAASLADTLLYEYPQVNAYLMPSDMEAMEYEFRQWAADKLTEFTDGYIVGHSTANSSFAYRPFDEYYKLGTFKAWFDDYFGKETNMFGDVKREIEYTSETMTEEQYDELYLFGMLTTLSEMKKADPDFMEKYMSLSKKERKTYTLSVGGTWEENAFLKEADEKAALDAAQEWAELAVDGLDLAVTAIDAYSKASNPSASGFTQVTINWEYYSNLAATMVKDMAKTVTDNLRAKADNELRNYILEKAVTEVMNAKEADIACIKAVYLTGNCGDERAVRAAEKIVNYYESLSAQDVASKFDDEDIKAAMDQFGIELQAELETSEVIFTCAIDSIKAIMKGALSNLPIADQGNVIKDSKGQMFYFDDSRKNFETSMIGILNAVIDQLCENWKEDCIENGKITNFFTSAFDFSEEDWNIIIKEINIFDIITDTATVKNAGKTFTSEQAPMSERLFYLFVYYMTFELPEGAIDDLIDRKTNSEYVSSMWSSLKNNIVPCLFDAIGIFANYQVEKLVLPSTETRPYIIEAVKKKANNWKFIGAMDKVVNKAWQFGEDIAHTYTATRDAATGEDGMSELAQSVLIEKNLSQPSHDTFIHELAGKNIQDIILGENAVSVQQILSWCDTMNNALRTDVSGATAYFNVVVQSENERKNTDFIKLIKGGSIFRYSIVQFKIANFEYDYWNIDGNRGLLTVKRANEVRDLTIDWKEKMEDGWKEEWRLLPLFLESDETN